LEDAEARANLLNLLVGQHEVSVERRRIIHS
jgi:hypothetical protein